MVERGTIRRTQPHPEKGSGDGPYGRRFRCKRVGARQPFGEGFPMNWTKTAPTKAGDWKWKDQDDWEFLTRVDKQLEGWNLRFLSGKPVGQMGGEWLPLYGGDVLAAEVEKAAREAETAFSCGESDRHWKEWWPESRAKRITTGETEPSL